MAGNGCGNCICIDLAPGEKGTVGQILYWERQGGPKLSRYTSFSEWLISYKYNLLTGNFSMTDDGYLEEYGEEAYFKYVEKSSEVESGSNDNTKA